MPDAAAQIMGMVAVLGIFLAIAVFAGIYGAMGVGNGIAGAILSVVFFATIVRMVLGAVSGGM